MTDHDGPAPNGGDLPTVVVADADEGVRSLVRLTLGADSYHLVEATDAAEAIQAIASARPELILIDAALPGAGGVALTRSLKAQPETREAAVVLLVDKGEPVPEDEGRDAGVDGFLAKPFNAFALLKKVGGFLGERAG